MVMLGGQRNGFMTQADFEAAAVNVDQLALLETLGAVSSEDTAIMMYTSGTTAHPKGCPLHHDMLVQNGINMNQSRYFLTDQDRFWAPLPMFHMASILPMLCCIDAGAALLSMVHMDAGESLAMLPRRGNLPVCDRVRSEAGGQRVTGG